MAVIVIIEDEHQMRRLLARILQGAGHTVHEAENGRAGIELCTREKPDLVVTDIIMPDVEGIETIRELRRDRPTLPIIAISGGTNSLYLRSATGLGATAALPKPFAADDLLTLVDRFLAP